MIIFYLFQDAIFSGRWYETPTGAAALVALIGVLCAPFINSWIQNREKRKARSLDTTDTALKINRDERKEAVDLMTSLHKQEISHFKRQMLVVQRKCEREILAEKITAYEARERAHMYGNECQRLTTYAYRLQMLLTQLDADVPAFEFKAYPEIMVGLDIKVAEYRKAAEGEMLERRRLEDIEIDDDNNITE